MELGLQSSFDDRLESHLTPVSITYIPVYCYSCPASHPAPISVVLSSISWSFVPNSVLWSLTHPSDPFSISCPQPVPPHYHLVLSLCLRPSLSLPGVVLHFFLSQTDLLRSSYMIHVTAPASHCCSHSGRQFCFTPISDPPGNLTCPLHTAFLTTVCAAATEHQTPPWPGGKIWGQCHSAGVAEVRGEMLCAYTISLSCEVYRAVSDTCPGSHC